MAKKRRNDSMQAQIKEKELEELLRRAEDYYSGKSKHDSDHSAADEVPDASSVD
jgi:hypothetical protein